jgi:protein SCO1/2
MRLAAASESVIWTLPMRLMATLLCLFLAGCGKTGWHMTDISGGSPALDFHFQRASDGAAVTGTTWRGKVVALYFGYTHCPDICPATLANLTDVAKRVGPDFQILFVSVDPDRDTRAVLNDYAHAFTPQMEGLYGTANQLADAARRYRVAYFVKQGPPYEVMHSNAVFFFDRSGRARLVTTDTADTAAIAEDVKRLLSR